MNWQKHVEDLKAGKTVTLTPKGNSMTPKINSGDYIFVSPDIDNIKKDDIVFCKVKGKYFVHLITAVGKNRYQIGNNHGHVNGWTSKKNIFGKVDGVLRPY